MDQGQNYNRGDAYLPAEIRGNVEGGPKGRSFNTLLIHSVRPSPFRSSYAHVLHVWACIYFGCPRRGWGGILFSFSFQGFVGSFSSPPIYFVCLCNFAFPPQTKILEKNAAARACWLLLMYIFAFCANSLMLTSHAWNLMLGFQHFLFISQTLPF